MTGRVSCSKTLLERLLLPLLWGLNQPHNDLWDLCHRPVTAVELGGKQRRIATRTQDSIYTVANHGAHQSRGDKGGKRGGFSPSSPFPRLLSLTGRNVFRRRRLRRTPRVNNPINAKYNTPPSTVALPLPTSVSASLSAFVSGICKIIFSWELLYILNSYSIQDLQLPWQYLSQGKKRREREKKKASEREKEKGIRGGKRIGCVERVGQRC